MEGYIQKNIAGIVLSAGKSVRMGVPKFSLKLDNGLTFIEKIIDEYFSFGCANIVVVLNSENRVLFDSLNLTLPRNVLIVVNQHPEWERFYSLKLAANALYVPKPMFVSNIDNPFLDQQLLATMYKACRDCDYASAAFMGKGGHPFYLSKKVVADLRAQQTDNRHIKDFLSNYQKKLVPVADPKVLLNINTPDDLDTLVF